MENKMWDYLNLICFVELRKDQTAELQSFFLDEEELKGAYWISSNIAIAILTFSLLLPL